jgi:hypothetical protein
MTVGVQRVVQEDGTGCGLACVAMVVSCTYAEVRTLAINELGFDPAGPFFTDYADIRAILARFDYRLSRRTSFRGYSLLGPLSLLGVERAGSGEEDHWMVHVKCGLDRYALDPAGKVKSERRQDWWRIFPVSYANITKL